MNLTRWPDGVAVRSLSGAAAELVPRAVHLEVTSSTLNTQRWRPRKDFVANRLVAGQLQLASGSLLVIDETQLGESQLSADGVKNLTAIGMLATQQQLACDFMSYDVKIPLELSCMIVSQRRSIIKGVDVTVPLRPSAPLPHGTVASPPGSLDAARFLLGLVTRRPHPINISEEVGVQFANDFTSVRQQLPVTPELCSTWMGLARAHCLTHGEDSLTAERWQAVLQLERERLSRCVDAGLLSKA